MGASLVVAVLGLTLGQAAWEVGMRGESRLLRDAAGDLLLDPSIALEYGQRDLLLQAGYDPALTLRQPRARGTFNMLHRGHASASWRLARDTRVVAAQFLEFGSGDLSWLSSPADSPPSFVTRSLLSATEDVFTEATSLALHHAFSRSFATRTMASYAVTGGGSDAALAALPRTKTLRAEAGGAWLARRDAIALTLGASRGWVSTGALTRAADAWVSWRHAYTAASERALLGEPTLRLGERLGPRYETELAAGIAFMDDGRVFGTTGAGTTVIPTVALTFLREEVVRRPGATALRVTLRYVPVLDGITGALTPRGEASGAFDLRLSRHFVAEARAGIGQTIDGITPYGSTLAQGGAALRYEPLPNLSVSAGVRVARLPDTEWAAVVTTTWSERGRF